MQKVTLQNFLTKKFNYYISGRTIDGANEYYVMHFQEMVSKHQNCNDSNNMKYDVNNFLKYFQPLDWTEVEFTDGTTDIKLKNSQWQPEFEVDTSILPLLKKFKKHITIRNHATVELSYAFDGVKLKSFTPCKPELLGEKNMFLNLLNLFSNCYYGTSYPTRLRSEPAQYIIYNDNKKDLYIQNLLLFNRTEMLKKIKKKKDRRLQKKEQKEEEDKKE